MTSEDWTPERCKVQFTENNRSETYDKPRTCVRLATEGHFHSYTPGEGKVWDLLTEARKRIAELEKCLEPFTIKVEPVNETPEYIAECEADIESDRQIVEELGLCRTCGGTQMVGRQIDTIKGYAFVDGPCPDCSGEDES